MTDHPPLRLGPRILRYGIALLWGIVLGAGAHATLRQRAEGGMLAPRTPAISAPAVVSATTSPAPSPSDPPVEPPCKGNIDFHAGDTWDISGGPTPVMGSIARGWPCGSYSLLLRKTHENPLKSHESTMRITVLVSRDSTTDVYLPSQGNRPHLVTENPFGSSENP
jgi:hypothetical protein